MLAMHRAVEALSIQPSFVKVDGNRVPKWPYDSEAIVKGDTKVAEISAASILAKVTRDREVAEYERDYPGYGFAKHKGYPTAEHLRALEALGASPLHRRSFGPVKRALAASNNNN